MDYLLKTNTIKIKSNLTFENEKTKLEFLNKLRGEFGKQLYLENREAYNEIFEGVKSANENVDFMKNATPPKPYLIRVNSLDDYNLEITISLIGTAINQEEFIFEKFENVVKKLINKSNFSIININNKSETIKITEKSNKEKFNKGEIIFITPIAINIGGKITGDFEFKDIIKRFFERYTAIAYNWCNEKEVIDYRNVIEAAENINIVKRELKLEKILRKTGRSNSTYLLMGFKGKIEIEGEELWRFKEIIEIAENINIGKYTDWGFGEIKFEIRN